MSINPFRTSLSKRIKKLEKKLEKKPIIKTLAIGQQIQCSKEGPAMISELISNYKLNQHNMVETINRSLETMDQAPASRKLLMKLLPVLNQSQSEAVVSAAIKEFESGIGTSWAKNLGEIIYCSHVMGLDVEKALMDLLESIKRSKALEEYSQRKNNEARLMVKWLTPASYFITTLIAIKFFDMSLGDFLSNQFHTSLGIWWFTIITVFYILTIAIYQILTKRKMDI